MKRTVLELFTEIDVMDYWLRNWFIGDMVILENGKKKNYCVKNEKGEILHDS